MKPLDGGAPIEPRGALRLRLLNDDYVADLRGPIACELLDDVHVAAIESALGPDPLDPPPTAMRAWDRIRTRRRTIAELLMDQSVLAGVGNVYRCEVLHRHRPRPVHARDPAQAGGVGAIWADLVALLPLGVAFSQILTIDDHIEEAS